MSSRIQLMDAVGAPFSGSGNGPATTAFSVESAPKSVNTSLAGFASAPEHPPGGCDAIPLAFE
ncbi:MAG TPA: hypothetical protein VK789_12255 [Bryobacteraceae bacterium]|nr:hypothetical protein [Bryobacteraceae bacterium]